jgi:hypothetical protein
MSATPFGAPQLPEAEKLNPIVAEPLPRTRRSRFAPAAATFQAKLLWSLAHLRQQRRYIPRVALVHRDRRRATGARLVSTP